MSEHTSQRHPHSGSNPTEKLGQNVRASKFPWPEVTTNESQLASNALDDILKNLEADLES